MRTDTHHVRRSLRHHEHVWIINKRRYVHAPWLSRYQPTHECNICYLGIGTLTNYGKECASWKYSLNYVWKSNSVEITKSRSKVKIQHHPPIYKTHNESTKWLFKNVQFIPLEFSISKFFGWALEIYKYVVTTFVTIHKYVSTLSKCKYLTVANAINKF